MQMSTKMYLVVMGAVVPLAGRFEDFESAHALTGIWKCGRAKRKFNQAITHTHRLCI